ncbi:MAG: DNA repair exonuclease [Syntrophobacterales bacterium]|jgi:DNA repair exonuclease SbcCD nuclease subunit|nr:DNA repair exonuclease [Syntrophobacterales bacterium]
MSEPVPFSFVHCADLHLDSPFEGIHAAAPRIAAVLREATFQALDRVIELAIGEQADFIIVAGDVHDGENRSLRAQLRFRDALKKADEAGIPCFIAHGNHDPLSGWEAHLEMPALAQRFGGQGVEGFPVRRGGVTLARIYGISYPVKEVRDNLARGFKRDPEAPFAIGVLHCNVGGDPSHDNYAPCNIEDLVAAGLDYWALGHIHAQRIVRASEPCIVYSGNTQGRNWREMGPRGCYLVRVDAARRITPTFVATDVVRWFKQDLDIGGLATWDELLDALARVREEVRAATAGRAAVARLTLTGRGELHRELAQRVDLERDLAEPLREGEPERHDFVWVEAVENRSRPPLDLAQRRLVQDFVGDFLNAAEKLRQGGDPGAGLKEVLSRRPEYRVVAAALDQLNEADLLAILNEAEILGVDRLLPEED